MSLETVSFLSQLQLAVARILSTPGALPDDWAPTATTYDLPRFSSEAEFAGRLRSAVATIVQENVQDAQRLRQLLAECGLPYDYARLGQPLSTLFEIFLKELTGVSDVISFASRSKPWSSVVETAAEPVHLFSAGSLPQAEGAVVHPNWSGPVPPGGIRLWVSADADPSSGLAAGADGVCCPAEEGGVLLIQRGIDPAAIRLIRKRTASALLAPNAENELRRLVGLPVAAQPAGDFEAQCDRALRELFPRVADSLYFCTGLAAESVVFRACAETLCPDGDQVRLFYAQNGYGGTGQLIADLLPRQTSIVPVPLPVLEPDASGHITTLVERVVTEVSRMTGEAAFLFLEMPTNPELQLHDFDALFSALREYRERCGVTLPVLVDTTLSPLYPLLDQPWARGWPVLCVKSGSKYFTRGKATLGVAFAAEEPISRSIMERARALGRTADTLARPSQLAAAADGLQDLRPRMARIAEKTIELSRLLHEGIEARGREVVIYSVTPGQVAQGLATGMLSFYLPAAPTTAADLVDEFVEHLLREAPALVRNRVSYGQLSGIYVINPQESTQGSLPEATKNAQKRDNVQICRISVSEEADVQGLAAAMESFFELKYGPRLR